MTEENTPVQTRAITARRLKGSEDENRVESLYRLSRFCTYLDFPPAKRRSDERVGLFGPGDTLFAVATFGIAENQKDLGNRVSAEVEIQDRKFFPVLTMARTCALSGLEGFNIFRLLALRLASRLNVSGRPMAGVIGFGAESVSLHALDHSSLWIEKNDRGSFIPRKEFRQSIVKLRRLIGGELPAYRWMGSKLPFPRYMPGSKKRI